MGMENKSSLYEQSRKQCTAQPSVNAKIGDEEKIQTLTGRVNTYARV